MEQILTEEEMVLSEAWLSRTLRSLFPMECSVAVQRYDRPDISLPEPEDIALDRAVEGRRREFSAGRVAAASALAQLGIVPQRISVGPNRNPLWPKSIVGSITHTAGLALAVVARHEKVSAVGLDLERSEAVKPELWEGVLTKAESDWLSAQPSAQRNRFATVIFSAKETFHKLQFPVTATWLDFHDAAVAISPERGEFSLTCTQTQATAKLRQSEYAGHFAVSTEFIVTAMHLSPKPEADLTHASSLLKPVSSRP